MSIEREHYNTTANDGTVDSLLAQLESNDLSHIPTVEITKVLDGMVADYQDKFETYLDLREEQATIVENRLEQMSLKQQQIINSLESNRPNMLSSPQRKAEHQRSLAASQQRRITIENKIERVKEYRSDLENNQDSFKKQFEKSLAAKKDDWFQDWKEEMIVVKKMMENKNEIERQKKLSQETKKKTQLISQGLSLKAPKIKLLQTHKIDK